MLRQSEKRTEERTQLKRKRDEARVNLRRGKRDLDESRDTDLAAKYSSGELAQECKALEAEYNTTKLEGVARFIGDRVHM